MKYAALPSIAKRPLTLWCAAMLALASPATHALTNGSDTDSFSAVGALGTASGVLISDNWVLTAAHVARSIDVGTVFESLVGNAAVDAIYTFSTASFPGHDIALLRLDTALSAALPILNDQPITSGAVSRLGTVTLVSAQNQDPNGVGTSTATSVMNTYRVNGTNYTVNWLVTDGDVELQGGDSGSALFKGAVGDSGGATLLGIGSAFLTGTGDSAQSAFVQVAAYKSWIDSTMAGSGQQALWVSSVPEPSSAALFGLGALGMAWAWRRQTGTTAGRERATPAA